MTKLRGKPFLCLGYAMWQKYVSPMILLQYKDSILAHRDSDSYTGLKEAKNLLENNLWGKPCSKELRG